MCFCSLAEPLGFFHSPLEGLPQVVLPLQPGLQNEK